jgi:hypothetical protein
MSFNSYWYLGLSISSLILLIYTCLKKGSIRSLLLFLIMVECAFLIETVIYIFSGSYAYHPNIIKYNDYYDSHIGALASNLFAVPVLATFITAFRLGWTWMFIFAAFLAGIEWLFLKLRIYTHYWWRIEYTSLGLFLVYFPLAKRCYHRILRPLKGFLHSLLLFLCIGPISATTQFIPIIFFSNRYYLPGWFENSYYDTTAFASIYYLSVSFLHVILAKLHWKRKWFKYLVLSAVLFVVTLFLQKGGILHSTVWWDPWYYILFPLIVLKITVTISKRLYHGPLLEKH